VADSRQFGNPKPTHFGGTTPPGGDQPGDAAACAQCEAMLADALDGALSAADQALFDTHMAHCDPCSQMLADARRGAAWLEILRDPRPEPPAALLERILAQTSGVQAAPAAIDAPQHHGSLLTPSPIHGGVAPYTGSPHYGAPAFGKVIPFRSRVASAVRTSAFAQVMLQPRLAMTAAMAFFSIALTMDLTGVRLRDLHASDLRPENLQRSFYQANASVVRYYEGLRVVYELESRVHDLESATGDDTPAGTQTSSPNSSQDGAAPNGGSGKDNQPDQPQTAPGNHAPAAQPQPRQSAPTRPTPKPGTSRREDLTQSRRLVAANRGDHSSIIHATAEEALA